MTSEEVRTVSVTGGAKGVKAEAYHLLPREGLDAIARVFGYGAQKYGEDHNWRRGYEWSKSFAAMQRHAWAHQAGETYDPESGLPHLAHAGFHVLAMLTWLEEQGEGGQFDDRYRAEAKPDAASTGSSIRFIQPSLEELIEERAEEIHARDCFCGEWSALNDRQRDRYVRAARAEIAAEDQPPRAIYEEQT